MSNSDENFLSFLDVKLVKMNSKRELRHNVRMYSASVVPCIFERTVFVVIVKMQLYPIAFGSVAVR